MAQSPGKYQFTGVIGTGATGTVHMAYHHELGRYVAIKELSPSLAQQPGFLERFRAEAQVMARLESPNCVKVYEFYETDGRAFLVEEYVEGSSLRKVVSQAGTLTAEQSLGVLKGALSGLGYAHALGLIHRDIKPENVLVDKEGVSKLADFGQAVFTGIGPGAAGGISPGTPAYMSPGGGPGRCPGCPQRRLLRRRDGVRAPHRASAIPRRHSAGNHADAARGPDPRPSRGQPQHP